VNAISKSNQDSFSDDIQSIAIAIVDFSGIWCAPCRITESIVVDSAEKNSDIKFFKIDVDENPQLVANFEVRSIPTTLFFKNGNVVNRITGVFTQSHFNDLIEETRKLEINEIKK